ncbi:MAG: MFS transporter [Anaerolineae bacterium]|nr:MAG: MFS transporter [Anaerolineae bacterium]
MKRVSLPYLLLINAYWFGLSVMWNSLHVLILPAVLLHHVPEARKNTVLGLLTFAGLVIAMLVQPISGWWSDRSGRRTPFIFAGTALDLFFLALLGWAGGVLWIAAGYIGLQLTSNLAHAPALGLIPDRVPREQHGAASGIKNLFDMGGLVVASLLVGTLLDPADVHPVLPMIFIAVLLLLGAVITLGGIRRSPRLTSHTTKTALRPLRLLQAQPAYARAMAARFVFLLGVYALQGFAQYFIRDVIAPPNAVKLTGDLMATITLPLIAFAVGGGWLGDRVGHRSVLLVSCGLATLGALAMASARTAAAVLAFGAVLGMGIGLFLTANWALLAQLAPPSQAGAYLGLTNLATAGSGAAGRLLGPLIDRLNLLTPHGGYTFMFLFAAFCAAASAWLLRQPQTQPAVSR